mgnify:CR=1 FL=1
MKIIVTGCLGFIGINFVNFILKNKKDIKVLGIDNLTYASNKFYLTKLIKNKNFSFVKLDISSKKIESAINSFKPNKLINFAAESHVDNSINSPEKFIKTNINGVYNLLHFSNKYYQKLNFEKRKHFLFLQISTDEVYGSLTSGIADENSKYNPSSPYSASKASADHLVNAWQKTYNLPTIITNTCNNFGPFQNKEKFIPTIISSILNNKNIPLYGNGENIREWIFVEDHVRIIYLLLKKGKIGEKYNIGSNIRISNLKLIKKIINNYGKNHKDIELPNLLKKIKFVKDRLGHDQRYAINSKKVLSLIKYQNLTDIDRGLKKTIDWYIKNL